jgi:hypothetical protein
VGFSFWVENGGKTLETKNRYTEDKQMADQTEARTTLRNLSLDGWAVAIALLLAALVRLGVLKHVSW